MYNQNAPTTAQKLTQAIDLPKAERQSTRVKKQRFLKAYKLSHGIVSLAASYAGVHRDTYYDWVRQDADFRDDAEYILWDLNTMVEDKLLELIMEGHAASIRFYLSRRHPDYMKKVIVVHQYPPITKIEDLLNQNPYA